jgi:hypothetical protein
MSANNNNELHIANPYATVMEHKDLECDNKNMLRVYKYAPNSLAIQIRTNKPISSGSKKNRNMIATAFVNVKQANTLVDTLIKFVLDNPRELLFEEK